MDCDEIGQPPAQKVATISRGDDFGILFAFKSGGQVVNLTGWLNVQCKQFSLV